MIRNAEDLGETLQLAVAYHNAGRVADAEGLYRQILEFQPKHPQALHLLGLLAHQAGKHEIAIETIKKAIEEEPGQAAFFHNLGEAYRAAGDLSQAVSCHERALILQPDLLESRYNLGLALQQQGRWSEAAACFERVLEQQPADVDAHYVLGELLARQEKFEEAVCHFQRAVELRPTLVQGYEKMGVLWLGLGRPDEAIPCLEEAIRRNPDNPDTHNNLGNAFLEQRRMDEARACFEAALYHNASLAEAHNNLGIVLWKMDLLDEAVASFQKALSLKPGAADFHNNLANVKKDQGQIEEAILSYREAQRLRPANPIYQANILCGLSYHPGYTSEAIFEEHRQWEEQYALPYTPAAPAHPNDRSPDRRLRIGYVSPDFRDHVVGRNIWPLLRNHDARRFSVTLYANMPCPDTITAGFQECAEAWRPIAGLSDERVADMIRQDRIDVLVDLALHTAGNRLLVFARKPAPVQVTFAGYPGTTGLRAIDYRLTDPYLDPPEKDNLCYAERSYRLPHCFWCYDPESAEPEVSPLAAPGAGLLTFGCLNNFCKVNDEVLRLLAKVLCTVPRSRLLLLAKEGSHQQRTKDLLAAHGVAGERVTFLGSKPRREYLAVYHDIDIALDTFPYNGHTTSLDALWMGVPVITLVGRTVAGRAGFSQLSNLRLEELAAWTPEEFVRLATSLAADLPRLAKLRGELRERMRQSPLMDSIGFARDIEAAFRAMWRTWCAH